VPDVAAFDFDGTLAAGGSVYGFLTALRGRGPVLAASLALAGRLAHAAMVGGTVADDTKELLFRRLLAGLDHAQAEEVASRFVRHHLDRHLRSSVHQRLDWHRDRGDRVVIVSASPELYVREAGVRLGADAVVATRLEVDDRGALTGRYRGANCRGDEKLRRLRRWIDETGPAPDRLWAYGNSRGDLTMLRAADVGINVGHLGPVGQLRSFPGLAGTGPDRNSGGGPG
jgi:phosphatidylglycerophosphatase C